MKRGVIIALAAALVGAPLPARADITGPCSGSIGGTDVRSGHGTPGSAVKVPYDATVSVGGSVAGTARAVRYQIELAGIQREVPVTIQTGQKRSSWSGRVEMSKYAWATVGLFKVTGAAATSAGRCSGVVYICITGKSPVTTAAGGAGTAAFIGGLILLAVSIAKAKDRAAGESAFKAFFPGAIAGAGALLFLQQSCVVPLNVPTMALVPIAVGIGGSVLAPVVGGILGVKEPPGGYTPAQPSSAPPVLPPDVAPRVNLKGPNAINTLIAAGATQVPGTIHVRPPDRDLPGILGTTFTTKKIPDPANPGQTIDVIDPSSVIVLAEPHAIPAPAPDVSMTPPPPPPVAAPPPAPTPAPQAPSGPLNSDKIVKALTGPGGGTITIPAGDIGPLLPPGIVDGNGAFHFPPKVAVPNEVRKMFDDKPPPSMAITEDRKIVVDPPKQTSLAGKLVEAAGTWVSIEVSNVDGKIHGKAELISMAGMAQLDISKYAQQGFDAINKGLKDKGVRIKTLTVDANTGITITTEPIPK